MIKMLARDSLKLFRSLSVVTMLKLAVWKEAHWSNASPVECIDSVVEWSYA